MTLKPFYKKVRFVSHRFFRAAYFVSMAAFLSSCATGQVFKYQSEKYSVTEDEALYLDAARLKLDRKIASIRSQSADEGTRLEEFCRFHRELLSEAPAPQFYMFSVQASVSNGPEVFPNWSTAREILAKEHERNGCNRIPAARIK